MHRIFSLPCLFAVVIALLLPAHPVAAGLYEDMAELKKICDAGVMPEDECKSRRAELWAKYKSQHTINGYCSYGGETLTERQLASGSESSASSNYSEAASASQIAKEILDAVGLAPNFVVAASFVPNAAAIIRGNQRYVEYNPTFRGQLKSQAKTNWSIYSVLAHEIGHHLQGHTITGTGSRPDIELQADEYSGFVLAKLGATKEQARRAMEVFGTDVATPTHPARTQRIAAIQRGWDKGTKSTGGVKREVVEDEDLVDICTISDIARQVENRTAREKILKACNEKVSDAPACNIRKVIRLLVDNDPLEVRRACSREVRSDSSGSSSICQIGYGRCYMNQLGPIGIPCWCPGPFGVVNGVIAPY